MMTISQRAYSLLFNAITDALRAMEAENFGQARDLLVRAQQAAEEEILSRNENTADGF